MGIFDKIKNAIWGEAQAATPTAETPAATPSTPAAPVPAAGSAAPASGSVDVGAILDAAVKKSGQALNWKTSIVDLMKALGLDSSSSTARNWRRSLAIPATSMILRQ